MSEWKEYKLGDIAQVIPGYAFKGKDFGSFGYPVVKIGDINPPNVDLATCMRIPDEKVRGLEKFILRYGDFVLAMTGATLGKVGVFRSQEIGYLNQRVAKFESKPGLSDKKFLYYLITNPQVANEIVNRGLGSAQPNISGRDIESIIVDVPSLPTQTAIAEILSSLDDKIELNNKINQELEALAQALFKRWFVDFEFPNENGEPYKSSGGVMVDSELGEIPKGWEVGNLNQIAKLLKKSIKPFEHPDVVYYHYSLPEFDSGKIPSIDLGEKILSSKYQVEEHSILVSKLNPRIPRVWTIIKPSKNSICSTEFQVLKPIDDIFFPFVNCLCLSEGYVNSIQSKVTGTSSSHQRVNPNDIINYEMTLPTSLLINQFHGAVYESLIIIDKNRTENVQLKTLRDTLLPKLISGELKINEISH